MKNFKSYFVVIPVVIFMGFFLFRYCSRSQAPKTAPLITEAQVDQSSFSATNILVKANFLSLVADSVKAYGLCWGANQDPLITDNIMKKEESQAHFSLNIAPFLQPGTKYFVRAFVVDRSGKVFYSANIPVSTPVKVEQKIAQDSIVKKSAAQVKLDKQAKKSVKKSVVVIGKATTYEIYQTETSFSVEYDAELLKDAIFKGVCYSDSRNPTIAYNMLIDAGKESVFTGTISNLMPDKVYHYRPYIITAKDTIYGENQDFKTLKIDVPIVGSVKSTRVKGKFMFVSNSILHDGGTAISERGVCWSTEQNPTVDDAHSLDSLASGLGKSGAKVVGLTINTPYYLRAYASNSIGTGYGTVSKIYSSIAEIGDQYGGGIIFYLDETGRHGSVCAPVDQTAGIHWIGAILMCKQLQLNGYSDWTLPTKEELDLMYSNLYLSNIGGLSNYYWSSSESDYNDAWYWRMNYGSPYYNFKGNVLNVRAVRHF